MHSKIVAGIQKSFQYTAIESDRQAALESPLKSVTVDEAVIQDFAISLKSHAYLFNY